MTDHVEIQELMTTYAQGSSLRDLDMVVSTFAPDGSWELAGTPHRFKGHVEMRKGFADVIAPLELLVQMNAPAVIAIDGDRATARSYIRETGRLRGSSDCVEVVGHYNDRLVRTPKGWRFAHRTFTTVISYRTAALPAGLASA